MKQQDLWIAPPPRAAKACECIAAANEILKEKKLRLVLSLKKDKSPTSRRMVVETQPLTQPDASALARQRVRPALIANFCPFCGAPYLPD